MIWAAVLLALASALTVAFSTSVQHRAATEAPASVTGALGLIAHLVRRRVWLLGQLLGAVALVFHALALSLGPIVAVQPVAIMGMVFAPPVRAAMSRSWLPAREAVAVVLTFAGLVVFLLATAPRHTDVAADAGTFLLVAVFGVLAAVLVVVASRVSTRGRRAFLLGCGAGVLFGNVAVSLKFAMDALTDGGVTAFLTSWATWVCVVLGTVGIATNQHAYRCARLSASIPALNIVNVAVALVFGFLVFDEVPRHTPMALVVEVLAVLAIGYGLFRLAWFEEVHDRFQRDAEVRATRR